MILTPIYGHGSFIDLISSSLICCPQTLPVLHITEIFYFSLVLPWNYCMTEGSLLPLQTTLTLTVLLEVVGEAGCLEKELKNKIKIKNKKNLCSLQYCKITYGYMRAFI